MMKGIAPKVSVLLIVVGFTVQTEAGGEWRFVSRLPFLPFDRFKQGCLFTTDVSTVAVVEQIKVKACSENVLAKQSGRSRLIQCVLEALIDFPHLAVDVVISS